MANLSGTGSAMNVTFQSRALQDQEASSLQLREPVIVGGVEDRIDAVSPFGPIRAVQRRFTFESADALDTARRLHESEVQCNRVSLELRQFCAMAHERDQCWVKGVESLELNATEQEHAREHQFDASRNEWFTRHASC